MKLFEYYEKQNFLPTFANLVDEAALGRHERTRRRLFNDHLYLPVALFRGADVVEFGPDSGENSLAFAKWGARLTLVEPHQASHATINSYFDRFGLRGQLSSIEMVDVENYRSERQFDFIDAEGFISTIQPTEKWLSIFNGLLKEEGIFVITFCGRLSAFFDLLWKATYSRVGDHLSARNEETAWALFEPKWMSVPHARSFGAWVKDMLENPFIRRTPYMMDPLQLCADAAKRGFQLYSSWPTYRDALDVYWHKSAGPDRHLTGLTSHIYKSSLSGFFGRKFFLADNDSHAHELVWKAIEDLVAAVDRLIDAHDDQAFDTCDRALTHIRDTIKKGAVIANKESDISDALDVLEASQKLLRALRRKDVASATELCRNNAALIAFWGQPQHFVAFQKKAPVSSV